MRWEVRVHPDTEMDYFASADNHHLMCEQCQKAGIMFGCDEGKIKNAKWVYVAGCPVEHIENVELIRDWIQEFERDDQ